MADRKSTQMRRLEREHPLCTPRGLALFCWLLTTKEGKAELAAWSKEQKRSPCSKCRHGFLSTKLGGLCGDVAGPKCPNREPRHA